MIKKKKILICPLEWGLGHAGRMIPIVMKLKALGHDIFIGAGNEHLALFRSELGDGNYIVFNGFKPGYSRNFPQYLVLFFKTPLLAYHTIKEHYRLKNIISRYKIDIVISDNRFGLWNRKIKSVYITHLPLIPFPKGLKSLEWTGIYLHRFIIKKYSYCYIPDLPGAQNISGRLSHGLKLPQNTRYIGLLSRFSFSEPEKENNETEKTRSNVVLMLSGPEPQRGILREKIINILRNENADLVILEGNPMGNQKPVRDGNICSYNHLQSTDLRKLLLESDHIISRSGYSTIMELISLKISALLIPTPGQPEQEYLAEYLSGKGWFSTIDQKDINKGLMIPARVPIPVESMIEESNKLIEGALEELLNQ